MSEDNYESSTEPTWCHVGARVHFTYIFYTFLDAEQQFVTHSGALYQDYADTLNPFPKFR
ncbi:hypothetical protein Dfri01_58620 [Dyadobacter frigoris]|nr:hypothetical protein Dfri01_58620 [Dyadobacter frigoris]